MPVESPPQLPGPTVFIVGFASEKHDSLERLPGHRHGAGDTALLVVYAWRIRCAGRQGVLHGGPAGAVSTPTNLARGARRSSAAEHYPGMAGSRGPLRPKRSGGVQRGQSPLGGFLVTFCPYKKSPGTGARSPGPSTKMADIRKKQKRKDRRSRILPTPPVKNQVTTCFGPARSGRPHSKELLSHCGTEQT